MELDPLPRDFCQIPPPKYEVENHWESQRLWPSSLGGIQGVDNSIIRPPKVSTVNPNAKARSTWNVQSEGFRRAHCRGLPPPRPNGTPWPPSSRPLPPRTPPPPPRRRRSSAGQPRAASSAWRGPSGAGECGGRARTGAWPVGWSVVRGAAPGLPGVKTVGFGGGGVATLISSQEGSSHSRIFELPGSVYPAIAGTLCLIASSEAAARLKGPKTKAYRPRGVTGVV